MEIGSSILFLCMFLRFVLRRKGFDLSMDLRFGSKFRTMPKYVASQFHWKSFTQWPPKWPQLSSSLDCLIFPLTLHNNNVRKKQWRIGAGTGREGAKILPCEQWILQKKEDFICTNRTTTMHIRKTRQTNKQTKHQTTQVYLSVFA